MNKGLQYHYKKISTSLKNKLVFFVFLKWTKKMFSPADQECVLTNCV